MSLPGLQAVIFAMDGLLFDIEPVYQRAWQQAAAEQGFALGEELYRSFVGRASADAEALLTSALGAGFVLPAFLRRWQGVWHERVSAHGVAAKAGPLELPTLLEARGLPRAVATSSSRADAEICLRELQQRFMAIVSIDDVSRGKPAPDLLLRGCRLSPVPAWCLKTRIAGVDAAGMPVIQVPDLQEPSPRAARQALRMRGSLKEVAALLAEVRRSA